MDIFIFQPTEGFGSFRSSERQTPQSANLHGPDFWRFRNSPVCRQGKPYRPFHDGMNCKSGVSKNSLNSPMTSTKEEVLRIFGHKSQWSGHGRVEIHSRPILGHVIPEAVKSKHLPLCHSDNAHHPCLLSFAELLVLSKYSLQSPLRIW